MILHNVGYLLGERHGSHHPGCHLIKVRREFNLSTNRLNAVALHRHQHSRQDGCASTRFLSMKALTIVGENDRTHGDDSSSNTAYRLPADSESVEGLERFLKSELIN